MIDQRDVDLEELTVYLILEWA